MKNIFHGFAYRFCLYFLTLLYGIFLILLNYISPRLAEFFLRVILVRLGKLCLFAAGIKLRCRGKEIMKQMENKSFIMISNHVEVIDVPVFLAGFEKHDIKYVYSLREASSTPIIGPVVGASFSRFGWISIKHHQDDADNVTSLKKVITAVRQEEKQKGRAHIAIFPEGFRTEDGSVRDFQEGAFLLSTMLQLPILPVFLKGLFSVHQHNKFAIAPGPVEIEVLEPIMPPAYDKKQDKKKIRKEVEKMRTKAEALYKSIPNLNTDARAPVPSLSSSISSGHIKSN